MLRVFLIFFLIFFSKASFSQAVFYFDKFFVDRSNNATPYRRELEVDHPFSMVVEFKHDSVILKGDLYGSESVSQLSAFTQFARWHGSPHAYHAYFKGMFGLFEFYTGGTLCRRTVVEHKTVKHLQVWDKNGRALLENGNGLYRFEDEEGETSEAYKDSIIVARYTIRRLQKDTVHYIFDRAAEPYGGMEAFSKALSDLLNYPALARLAGKEGVVYIQFIVDKDGRLTELTPLSDKGFNLEKKAVDKLKRMPPWHPAYFGDQRVKSRFVIPICFRLLK